MLSDLSWMDYPFIANSYSFKTPLKEHVFQKVPSDLASSVLGCHYTYHASMIPQNSPGVCLTQHLSSWLETNLVFLFIFPPDHEPFKASFACFHYTLHPSTELGTQQEFSFNKHMQLHWIIYYVKVIYQSSLKHMRWILTINHIWWSTKYKWKEVKLKMIIGSKKKLLKKRIRKKNHENQYTVFRERELFLIFQEVWCSTLGYSKTYKVPKQSYFWTLSSEYTVMCSSGKLKL